MKCTLMQLQLEHVGQKVSVQAKFEYYESAILMTGGWFRMVDRSRDKCSIF